MSYTKIERIKLFDNWQTICRDKIKEFKKEIKEIETENSKILESIIPVDEFTFWFIEQILLIKSEDKLKLYKKQITFYSYLLNPNRRASFTEADKEMVKDIPMQEVCEMYGIDVKRNKCLCPFHEEKTSSFSINPKTNRYKCFGCNEGGDTINFVMKMDNINFKEAVIKLKGNFN